MAENLSSLINLDLINKIYKTINAQIKERVYDPLYKSTATLGDETHPYVSAHVTDIYGKLTGNVKGNLEGDVTGDVNNITLTKTNTGFTVTGGTAAKTLTVDANTSIQSAATIGAANTGAVTVKSEGAAATIIVGPNNGTATLVSGTYTNSATTSNATAATVGTLVKRDTAGAVTATEFNGGDINLGDLGTLSAYPAVSKKIKATGGTDGVEVFYEVTSADTGRLVVKSTDDANAGVEFRNSSKDGKTVSIVNGAISASSYNNLNLEAAATGFKISGGTTSKTATISDTVTINKALTVGADNTGAVTIESDGAGATIITGPSGGTAALVTGTYTSSATTNNNSTPTKDNLLKIKEITKNTFLAGPKSGNDAVPTYRALVSDDIPDNAADTTGKATTAGTADKVAHGLTVKDGSTAAISGWVGSADKTLSIKGSSPITSTATADTITITHNTSGPSTTANTSKGDSSNQTPAFGGEFKVLSATVDKYGHTTALADHTVTIPSLPSASTSVAGIIKIGTTSGTAYDGKSGNDLKTAYTAHAADKANPHNVTAAQVSALALSGGTVTGDTKFSSDTNANTSRNTGAVVISGGLSVMKDIYAEAVHNAVWNDLADAMEVPENTKLLYGYCYTWDRGKVVKTSRYSKNCIGIHSDTAGFTMGEKTAKTIKVAVAGFVLAHLDKVYPEGTPLTWGNNGKLTKCSLLERLFHPERVIATFYKQEAKSTWHGILVNKRHWVKIK